MHKEANGHAPMHGLLQDVVGATWCNSQQFFFTLTLISASCLALLRCLCISARPPSGITGTVKPHASTSWNWLQSEARLIHQVNHSIGDSCPGCQTGKGQGPQRESGAAVTPRAHLQTQGRCRESAWGSRRPLRPAARCEARPPVLGQHALLSCGQGARVWRLPGSAFLPSTLCTAAHGSRSCGVPWPRRLTCGHRGVLALGLKLVHWSVSGCGGPAGPAALPRACSAAVGAQTACLLEPAASETGAPGASETLCERYPATETGSDTHSLVAGAPSRSQSV